MEMSWATSVPPPGPRVSQQALPVILKQLESGAQGSGTGRGLPGLAFHTLSSLHEEAVQWDGENLGSVA